MFSETAPKVPIKSDGIQSATRNSSASATLKENTNCRIKINQGRLLE